MAKRKSKVQTITQKKSMNIGLFIFGAILFYLMITILLYVTTPHVTSYEVKEGSILNENTYSGFIVRDEEVIKSKNTGYINFFVLEGSKVGAKTCVYALSSEELDFQTEGNGGKTLTPEETNNVLSKIHSFSETFQETQYDNVNMLKDNINIVLDSKSNQNRLNFLDSVAISGTDLKTYDAESDGIISYTYDGYESVSADQVTSDMLGKKDYNPVTIKNNTYIEKEDIIYKVIRSNNWTVVLSLTEEQYELMKEKKYVEVEFTEDNSRATADIEVKKTKSDYFAYLRFQSDMVRFSDERYIGVRVILDDEEGLKIPVSSVVEKDFYIVPDSYITKGGDTTESGVLVLDKSGNAVFKPCAVYYIDKDHNAYLNPLSFDEKVEIRKESTTESMVLSEKKSLKGVYNINKGYASFRLIDILCQSDEYYIVSIGTDYGLSNFDHIALNASKIKENDVIY